MAPFKKSILNLKKSPKPFNISALTISKTAIMITLEEIHIAPPHDESVAERQLRKRLIDAVKKHSDARTDFKKMIPTLGLHYVDSPEANPNCCYSLAVGLILAGRKHVVIGNCSYFYGAGSMIMSSIEMPTSFEILNVSPDNPFASVSLKLDPALITELLAKMNENKSDEVNGFSIDRPVYEMLEDFDRLLRLLEHPEQIAERAPLLIRDIHYLAVHSAAGRNLQGLYSSGSVGQRIRKSIEYVSKNFRDNVSIEELAGIAGMAVTTFHRHFKEITRFSPLQYQKRLRLYEAQQFLLRGEGDVNSAAFSVGYQSPQQFSRDYKKLFGMPPGHNAKEVRKSLSELLSAWDQEDIA